MREKADDKADLNICSALLARCLAHLINPLAHNTHLPRLLCLKKQNCSSFISFFLLFQHEVRCSSKYRTPSIRRYLIGGIRLSSNAARYSSDKNPGGSLRTLLLLTWLSFPLHSQLCVPCRVMRIQYSE